MMQTADSRPSAVEVWDAALLELRDEVSQPTYNTWLSNISPVSLADHTLTVAAPNEFIRDWLERRYSDTIAECASRVTQEQMDVSFVVAARGEERQAPVQPVVTRSRTTATPRPSFPDAREFGSLSLNPAYVFDTFVVGRSNQLSHAAAVSVSNALAEKYNPLFIHGDVGLGKTHLMQAIGHRVRQNKPDANIVYISGENFLYHVVSSIREDRWDACRRAYRAVDLWLMDDIQHMVHGDRTQIEFFHVFNDLYQTNRQIVICSDKAPKDLDIEDRLRSRFEWGLITELGRPDFEHRVAILQRKAETEAFSVPEEILHQIANGVTASVRALEGCLTHLIAQCSLTQQPPTPALARQSMEAYTSAEAPARLTTERIQRLVAEHYGVTVEQMKSQKRNKSIMIPRQVAMFLARELTGASLPELGRSFGGRDHSTVIHSCDKIKNLLTSDAALSTEVEQLRSRLTPSPG